MRWFGVLLVALAAATWVACGGGDAGAGDEPSSTSSASREASPAADPASTPVVSGDAAVIDLAATNISFSADALSAPAGREIVIRFTNNDSGVPHNVHVYAGETTSSDTLGATAIASGPATEQVRLGALTRGAYAFACDVHPEMEGTLTVE